jgi:hypothetical protein
MALKEKLLDLVQKKQSIYLPRRTPRILPPEGMTTLGRRVGIEKQLSSRVNRTSGNRSGNRGNRSYRSEPVPVPVGSQPVQIQNLNLNSKNEKKLTKFSKILQGV